MDHTAAGIVASMKEGFVDPALLASWIVNSMARMADLNFVLARKYLKEAPSNGLKSPFEKRSLRKPPKTSEALRKPSKTYGHKRPTKYPTSEKGRARSGVVLDGKPPRRWTRPELPPHPASSSGPEPRPRLTTHPRSCARAPNRKRDGAGETVALALRSCIRIDSLELRWRGLQEYRARSPADPGRGPAAHRLLGAEPGRAGGQPTQRQQAQQLLRAARPAAQAART
jgi:hypothetical protein